jgi:CBS domain containing-hemolysin-like protein
MAPFFHAVRWSNFPLRALGCLSVSLEAITWFVICVPLLVGIRHQNNVGICTFRALRGLYKTSKFI